MRNGRLSADPWINRLTRRGKWWPSCQKRRCSYDEIHRQVSGPFVGWLGNGPQCHRRSSPPNPLPAPPTHTQKKTQSVIIPSTVMSHLLATTGEKLRIFSLSSIVADDRLEQSFDGRHNGDCFAVITAVLVSVSVWRLRLKGAANKNKNWFLSLNRTKESLLSFFLPTFTAVAFIGLRRYFWKVGFSSFLLSFGHILMRPFMTQSTRKKIDFFQETE